MRLSSHPSHASIPALPTGETGLRQLLTSLVAIAYLGLAVFYGAYIVLGIRLLWQGLSGQA